MYQPNRPGYSFKVKSAVLPDKWTLLRSLGKDNISAHAQLKLEWIIFYHTQGNKNAKATAKHFGISRKTLHKWLGRFNETHLKSLEEKAKAPLHVRQRQITLAERFRIRKLRLTHLRYGKMKLQRLYFRQYSRWISSWKIQKVIEEENLYYDKAEVKKQKDKRKQAQTHKKRRITGFAKKDLINYLWHVDTVVFTLREGGYRYLLTAIDEVSKIGYARLYTSHSSKSARDFLLRLEYLTEGRMINLHHDNGSEFKKDFGKACKELNIPQWYSRPHTPKDNPVLERFNRTIQEEFIDITDIVLEEVFEFNLKLLDWLIEYNNFRPHQALDYLTPLEYLDLHLPQEKVLPMWSSSTRPSFVTAYPV